MSPTNKMNEFVLYGSQYDNYFPVWHELVSFYNRGWVFAVIYDISLSRQFRLNSLGPCWDSSVFAKIVKAIFWIATSEPETHISQDVQNFVEIRHNSASKTQNSAQMLNVFPTLLASNSPLLNVLPSLLPEASGLFRYHDKWTLPGNLQNTNFFSFPF